MRRPVFRGPNDTNWGIPPFETKDVWRELGYALEEVFHHLFVHRAQARRLRRHLKRTPGPIKVSIGSGRFVQSGWVGIDLRKGANVFRCDLRKRLPFEDASVDALLAEHIVEHFPLDYIPALLSEFLRVTKQGSPVRVVCPDPKIVFDLMSGVTDERTENQLRIDAKMHRWTADQATRLVVANRMVYEFGNHKALLTGEAIIDLLAAAGFKGIATTALDRSVYFDPVPGTHLARYPGSELEAVVVEAIRPEPGR
jgi:predicted SAM-dependent methyltransferase